MADPKNIEACFEGPTLTKPPAVWVEETLTLWPADGGEPIVKTSRKPVPQPEGGDGRGDGGSSI